MSGSGSGSFGTAAAAGGGSGGSDRGGAGRQPRSVGIRSVTVHGPTAGDSAGGRGNQVRVLFHHMNMMWIVFAHHLVPRFAARYRAKRQKSPVEEPSSMTAASQPGLAAGIRLYALCVLSCRWWEAGQMLSGPWVSAEGVSATSWQSNCWAHASARSVLTLRATGQRSNAPDRSVDRW